MLRLDFNLSIQDRQRKCNPFYDVYFSKREENFEKFSGSISGEVKKSEALEK